MEDGIESYMSILLDNKYNNTVQKKKETIQIIQDKQEPKSKETTNYK